MRFAWVPRDEHGGVTRAASLTNIGSLDTMPFAYNRPAQGHSSIIVIQPEWLTHFTIPQNVTKEVCDVVFERV